MKKQVFFQVTSVVMALILTLFVLVLVLPENKVSAAVSYSTVQFSSASSSRSFTVPNMTTTFSYTASTSWISVSRSTQNSYYISVSRNSGAERRGTVKVVNGTTTINYTIIQSAETYSIYYNCVGGSGTPSTQTKTYNVNLQLSSVRPSRSGYTFLGWSPSSSATAPMYSPGSTFSENRSLTLYAVWKANTYTISYYANGGSGVPVNQIKTQDINLVLSGISPTRTGYTFLGWSTLSYATVAQYQPNATYFGNGNMTLYAVWEEKTYAITYSGNGGTGIPSGQIKKYGTNLTLSYTKPTREGYTFLGWSTNKSASTPSYYPGSSLSLNQDMTLYAVWENEKYTISYNANGGSGAPSSQTKTYGYDLTLSYTKPTRTGYTFAGWATSSNATVVTYAPGSTYRFDGDGTLYAVWTANTYTVTYYANGGLGAPSSQTKTYGYDLTLSYTKPTRTGYTFSGWATSSSATIVTYAPGSIYRFDGNVTLYAVWTMNTYKVSYSSNGGQYAPSQQTKTYGIDLVLSTEEPFRAGYTFLGWSTDSAASVAQYQPGVTYYANSSTTLYAIWQVESWNQYASNLSFITNEYTLDRIAQTLYNAPSPYVDLYDQTIHSLNVSVVADAAWTGGESACGYYQSENQTIYIKKSLLGQDVLIHEWAHYIDDYYGQLSVNYGLRSIIDSDVRNDIMAEIETVYAVLNTTSSSQDHSSVNYDSATEMKQICDYILSPGNRAAYILSPFETQVMTQVVSNFNTNYFGATDTRYKIAKNIFGKETGNLIGDGTYGNSYNLSGTNLQQEFFAIAVTNYMTNTNVAEMEQFFGPSCDALNSIVSSAS